MDCGKHKKRIVLDAFSYGKCEKCGCDIVSSHIPCDVVCDGCSEKYGLCTICGVGIKKMNYNKKFFKSELFYILLIITLIGGMKVLMWVFL